MGLGDPPTPVASTVEVNNPTPQAVVDTQGKIDDRLTVLERSGNAEVVRQFRYLFDTLAAEAALTGDYTYPPA